MIQNIDQIDKSLLYNSQRKMTVIILKIVPKGAQKLKQCYNSKILELKFRKKSYIKVNVRELNRKLYIGLSTLYTPDQQFMLHCITLLKQFMKSTTLITPKIKKHRSYLSDIDKYDSNIANENVSEQEYIRSNSDMFNSSLTTPIHFYHTQNNL